MSDIHIALAIGFTALGYIICWFRFAPRTMALEHQVEELEEITPARDAAGRFVRREA